VRKTNKEPLPVRLATGALAVFSPVALTPEVKAKLQALGNNVRYIMAPDMEHHLFLSEWHAAYPSAHIIGPEGLPEKRAADASITHKVPFSTVFHAANKLDTRVSPEFDADFDYEFVDAHPSKEIIFFYRPDRTLIEADYLFSLPATEQYSRSSEPPNKSLLTRLFTILQSTQGSAIWQKRVQWYAVSSKDRIGFNASAQRIDKWDFDRIIPCHGDVMESDAKAIFRKVFGWHLDGKRK
jgi:Domain of unknown function (DUF4336)